MNKNRMMILTSIVLAMLVSSIDSTITNTTMPRIADELGGFHLYAWAFASYMIFSTILFPIAGRISDMYGRKTIFAGGTLMFLFGSLLCGFSGNMIQLVIFRGIQGLGAGIMMPFPTIIAGDLFPVEQRGKIQAFFSAMWGLSALLAPMLGSFFVEVAGWRWIFFVNVPICILSFLLILPYKEDYAPKRSAIDWPGALLFGAGVSLLLVSTVVSSYIPLYLLAGALVIAIFVGFERKHPSPIVPLELFHNNSVRWININSFIGCTALFGTSSYLPLFLQHQGYSIFVSGVALLGTSIGWMALGVPAGKWVLRYGYRPLLITANVLLVLSGLMLVLLDTGSGFWYAFFIMFIQGLAFGLSTTVSIIGSQQLVEPQQKGISTSLQMFSRNIGTAIGVTIMGAILLHTASFMGGIRHLFVYGLLLSLVALLASFRMREPQSALFEEAVNE